MEATGEWVWLRERVVAAGDRVAGLVRALPDGEARLPGSAWTQAAVGAHLVTVARRYRRMMRTPEPFPDSIAAQNERELAEFDERDPDRLAAALVREVAAVLDDLGPDGARPVPFFGMEHTAAGVAGVLLGELLLHGRDLALAAGRPWPITRDEAVAFVRGLLPAAVRAAVDPAVAARAPGTYHLHLRGGDDWTIRVEGGAVTLAEGRPSRADLRVSADPVTFVLTSYGRVGRARAALTGGVVAWGRKPWLAAHFARLFVET